MGILSDEMQRMVQRQRLGYVATVCPDGTPNLSPKGTTKVWDDSSLIFADLASPNTIRNLRHNPAIEVNVVDPISRKGYRFKGTARVLTEGDEFERALAFYEYNGLADPRRRIHAIVIIAVTQAQPLISPAYDSGASEAEIRAQWKRYWAQVESHGNGGE